MVPPARIELALQAYHACVMPLYDGGVVEPLSANGWLRFAIFILSSF